MRDAPAVLTGPMFFHNLFIGTLTNGAAFRGRIGSWAQRQFTAGCVMIAELLQVRRVGTLPTEALPPSAAKACDAGPSR